MSKEGRKFDLIIFGATGFTGSLASKYVASRYSGTALKWAVAGRSKSKLLQLAKECGDVPVIVADASDEPALEAMCLQTKVVAACAGPFWRYGKLLVKACVNNGTDYCDITGELNFVREMIALHDDAARASGARIVHLCGHDSVPWDLSTLMLSKKLKELEGPAAELRRVDFFTDIKSAPSGGTLETALGIMFGSESKLKLHTAVKSLGFDPLLKEPTQGNSPAPSSLSAKNVAFLSRQPCKEARQFNLEKPVRSFFFMAGVNANAVKRSNALNAYGTRVVYSEGQAFGSTFSALRYLFGLAWLGLCLAIPPVRWFMRAYILPKPGQGPSEESMASGFLVVHGVASSSKGTVCKSTMRFPVDPGYKDTARMVVESALALALDSRKLENPSGGVFTPGCCQREALLDRLIATGTSFECN
mmetsp:Transcript_65552/g.147926  ORF Transcript_65552/g.147926 Transcript_65552/m.147926 type:complete len:418 (+) Transcript_65552:133-1386(+)|eukprot:CAMPEP_0172590912 /NCGR_PEP_ID=MMETSP1068-20121228/9593_1 /TAXON_ID=35684 /ORGANISM="Pseudopedinella elastica, Strain CCMP716" /LENGTH=417 /DNA_ID=CAMNT_0013387085 /DNA_START=24 /DNA_END=1277 /DNA_ORIENTATION=+